MRVLDQKNEIILMDDLDMVAGYIELVVSNELIIISTTHVDKDHRKQGWGRLLVEESVKKARREGKKIIPLCPFAKEEFIKNEEYEDVLEKI